MQEIGTTCLSARYNEAPFEMLYVFIFIVVGKNEYWCVTYCKEHIPQVSEVIHYVFSSFIVKLILTGHGPT